MGTQGVMALAMCGAAVAVLGGFAGGPAPDRERGGLTLQVARFGDEESYCVDVAYEVVTGGELAASTFEIGEVRLRVTRHGLGYQRHRTLMEKHYEGRLTLTTSAVLPSWRGKYVPGPEFLLPTGRVVNGGAAGPLLVLFERGRCRLYRFDEQGRPAVAVPVDPDEHREALAGLYRDSFAPEDVYWCFALVHCSRFFGFEAGEVRFDGPTVDTQALYELWRAAIDRGPIGG